MTRDEDRVATVSATVDLISKKWHPAIIQALLESGPLRFNELKAELEGVSGKVLTDSLDDLVENDLVERTVITESPRRVEYELTAHGRGLQSALEELASWGDRHLGKDPRPVVLIVDDDPRLVKMHTDWLDDDYRVEQAYDGREGIRKLTEEVNLVLLDRRMPGISGEEVLARIDDLGHDCGVILLSAVEPDLDIVDMGYDDYVLKPTSRKELRETVRTVLDRTEFGETLRQYLALLTKRRLLEAEKTAAELKTSEEYDQLCSRLADLEERVEGFEDLDEDQPVENLLET